MGKQFPSKVYREDTYPGGHLEFVGTADDNVQLEARIAEAKLLRPDRECNVIIEGAHGHRRTAEV